MMAEPKQRLMRKLIPPGTIDFDGSTSYVVNGGGWEIVNALSATGGASTWAVWRGYIDLSGFVEQQETLFTINPSFQESGDFDYITTRPQGSLQIWDMITQEYITNESFNGALGGSGMWIPPGMMSTGDPSIGPNTGAPYELEDVHYGLARTFQYGPQTSFGTSPFHPLQTRSSSWGVGSATAGQKLYLTRAIHLTSAFTAEPLNEGNIPATAVVIPSVIMKEPDLHYIERLRRSYVVAATVD
jgi:hypothetical protein